MTQDNMKLEKQLIDTQYENIILKNRIKLAINYIKDNACFDKHCCDDLNTNECDNLIKILKGDDHE